MPEPERFSPQIAMIREGLADLPAVEPPDGYAVQTYRPGDAPYWGEIVNDAFGREPGHCDFDRHMRGDPAFRPERVFFIVSDARPVATASAWRHPAMLPDAGVIHYLAVRPGHQGHRLGYHVSLAALHRIRSEGLNRAWLLTDDHRLAAIRTYLNLSFRPWLVHENQRSRWVAIFDALGAPELKERFRPVLEGPVWHQSERHADEFDYEAAVVHRRRWSVARRPGRISRGEIDAYADESLYRPSVIGTAGANISEVRAGAERPFELWFRCGSDGLPAGAEILFWTPGQSPLGTKPQTDDPAKRGYVEASGPDTAAVEARAEPGFQLGGELRPGEEVRLSLGANGGFRWTPLAGRKEFKVLVDVGGGEPLIRLPEPVVVRVLPRKRDHVDLSLPGTAGPGGTVRAHLTVRDEFDNRVPDDGVIDLRGGGGRWTAHVSQGVGGVDVPFPGDAPLVLEAADGSARSNPCLPGTGEHLYFGDLHAHDLNSSAEGHTADVYRWAIEDKRLDFLAVPVQVHAWLDNDKWTAAKLENETFLDEGRFVSFLSFEWQHSHYGDKVVHYLGGDAPYLPIDDERYAHPADLYEALRGTDAVVVSHHPGYTLDRHVPGTDWGAMEPDVDRLVELWSMHGSSEGHDPCDRPLRPPRRGGGVLVALRSGLRVGFTAGSDTHSGRPGGSAKEPRPYWGGLCAVWAQALTRRALFEALRARRTVALTGARIALRFSVNGAPMGSELPLTARRELIVEVWGADRIARVELMRDGAALHVERPDADVARIEFEDPTDRPAFYHCRVTQADGHLAVCSPVWVG
jgi:mycothiol synthase